ncbi:NHL repeat-containing protein [Mesoterricola silvestris]|uniref:NHL repeat containing protein n=1 Tax=Mesoterricola silvestris TaxID=2927979 RepID=A0AA48H3K2_9BACT|nr:hypothetical protein [Mesoterricola silvestris]BDU71268.1 hypothetical protein METEAL_04420 [Mesoterricola silvestris]
MVLRPLLLAFALQPLGAQILVEPRHCVLQPGRSQAFTARTHGGLPVACAWTVAGPGGSIGPDGVFRGEPGSYTVRGASLADPGQCDETGVLVLPDHPGLRTVGEIRPEAFAPAWSEALPFLDFVTGRRLGPPDARVTALRGSCSPQRDIIGYGMPVTVTWPAPGVAPDAQLLSWMEGDEPVRRDVTGCQGTRIQARAAVTRTQVERLGRTAQGEWISLVHPLDITVRGLLPFAGNPIGPGDADGRGLSARFRRPEGLALLPDGTLAVADPEARALRLVSPAGEVTTVRGELFRAPAFVAARPDGTLLVADPGAHAILGVADRRTVTLLAGVPGLRGHRDAAMPAVALFDSPQGLALDPGGNLFVADRGNHVVRRITPGGEVSTVAGLPGVPGHQDGLQGTFSALRGLAYRHPGLYAVDGHSVRRIVQGEITTLCGDPATPGPSVQTAPGSPLPGRIPCLDDPHSLAVHGQDLMVTDRGNRTVLAIGPTANGRADLRILAGDRAEAGTRFGLLRLGIKGPLGEAFGALDGPRGLVADPRGDLVVADGTCIARLSAPAVTFQRRAPVLLYLPGTPAARGLPLTVDFFGPELAAPWPRLDREGPAHYHWTLDVLDAQDRPVLPRKEGVQRGSDHGRTELLFRKPGRVKLRLTCVTADGAPRQHTEEITVE